MNGAGDSDRKTGASLIVVDSMSEEAEEEEEEEETWSLVVVVSRVVVTRAVSRAASRAVSRAASRADARRPSFLSFSDLETGVEMGVDAGGERPASDRSDVTVKERKKTLNKLVRLWAVSSIEKY